MIHDWHHVPAWAWGYAVGAHMAEYIARIGRLPDDELPGYGLKGWQELWRRKELEQ